MRDKGFTLIELLVVIAIIGILASIVLVALGGARDQAKDARITSEMGQMRSKAELYYSSNNNSYSGFDCSGPEMSNLCDDIDSQNADNNGVTIHASDDEYCAYTLLNSGEYYCIDASGIAKEYSSEPTTCDGTTFTCE